MFWLLAQLAVREETSLVCRLALEQPSMHGDLIDFRRKIVIKELPPLEDTVIQNGWAGADFGFTWSRRQRQPNERSKDSQPRKKGRR